MNLRSLPWLLLPGLGQIHFGCPVRGLLLFVAFALALNAVLVATLVMADPRARLVSALAAAAIWLASAADGFRRLRRATVASRRNPDANG